MATRHVSDTMKLKRRVLTEVARLAMEDSLEEKIDELPEILVNMGNQRYRCCEYKEKAIYAERIKLALGLKQKEEYKRKRLSDLLTIAKEYPDLGENPISIIDVACEGCPINKFFVTNACQNCLAHSCQTACPRDAISVVQKQAYIDQNRCVECGLCKKSCPYNAIVEINRPCEASCQVGAIKADQERKAIIDYDKCVECGACITGCPYAAISQPSQIIKVVDYLKKGQVIAIIAPAFIGQLGQKESPGAFLKALEKLGFTNVYEAALGADVVALAESEEFSEKVPKELEFMTSSCCPGFVNLIKKHYPHLEKHISSTISPMAVIGKYLKEKYPDHKSVFIGPCVAKKTEAWQSSVIDAVLTFEELTAMLVAAGINVTEIETEEGLNAGASAAGRGFAQSGGVAKAVSQALAESDVQYNPVNSQGLTECAEMLKNLDNGKCNYNFLEGMACNGGCLGGPGTLMDSRITKRLLQKVCQTSEKQAAQENLVAGQIKKDMGNNLHRQK